MRRDLSTALAGVFLLAGVAALWWEAARQDFTVLGAGIAYDPLFFPRLLLAFGGICAIAIVALGVCSRPADRAEPRWRLWLALVLLISAYFWAMTEIGFPIATVPFVILFCALLGYRRWRAVIPGAFGIAASVWYIFTAWLQVPLPASAWLEGMLG